MNRFEKRSTLRCIAIVLILSCIAAVFTSCNGKQYNTKNDYKNTITEFADRHGFEIVDETEPWTDTFKISLSKGAELINFSFTVGNEKQLNRFDIACENPVSFDNILEIANELSKKEFSKDFYYNVINNENPFYNNDDEEHAYYKDEYEFYKSDYFVIFDSKLFSIQDDNYYLAYYSYIGDSACLSISGFTK